MSVTAAMKIILAKRSGNRCARPGCQVVLAQPSEAESALSIGEAAHISGARFPELREVAEHFSSASPMPTDSSLDLLSPDAKIKKNDLGPGSRNMITMGLALSSTIRRFVSEMESSDPDWPARLKNGFGSEYLRLRTDGHKGDELFELMSAYSMRGFDRPSTQCAAVSVLVYMFEACEVFER